MGMGRCQAPNPTRPVGRLPLIVSYILISLKICSILHPKLSLSLSHTHTHTNIHLTINMISNHPKTLTYIHHDNSHQAQHASIMHIIFSYSKTQTSKTLQRQKHGSKVHGINIGMLESNKHVIGIKTYHSTKHVHIHH